MMQPRMGGIIQANIPDVETLYLSYMPYVVGGGLFVPSKQPVKMGEEIFVLATLPEQSQKIPLTGKVIWISQKQNETIKNTLLWCRRMVTIWAISSKHFIKNPIKTF